MRKQKGVILRRKKSKVIKVYRARPSNRIVTNHGDAEMVGKELERLFPNGEVSAPEVVRAARVPDSPLHKYFEWDDAKAAHEYRVEQARGLIKAIVVEIGGEEIPAYHNVKIESGQSSYVETYKCKDTPSLWSQVVQTALNEAEAWSRRYKIYAELEPIHNAIQKTKGQIDENRKRKAS